MEHKNKMILLTLVFGPFIYLSYGKWKTFIILITMLAIMEFILGLNIVYLIPILNLYIVYEVIKLEKLHEFRIKTDFEKTEKSRQKIYKLVKEIESERESK